MYRLPEFYRTAHYYAGYRVWKWGKWWVVGVRMGGSYRYKSRRAARAAAKRGVHT